MGDCQWPFHILVHGPGRQAVLSQGGGKVTICKNCGEEIVFIKNIWFGDYKVWKHKRTLSEYCIIIAEPQEEKGAGK
jgi:hypothetical protein